MRKIEEGCGVRVSTKERDGALASPWMCIPGYVQPRREHALQYGVVLFLARVRVAHVLLVDVEKLWSIEHIHTSNLLHGPAISRV